jgi:hypothetical protein
MAVRRALIHVLLAFALLLAQQTVVAHAVTHLPQPPASEDQQLPKHKVCELCVLSAQFGSAMPGKLLSMEAPRDDAVLKPQHLRPFCSSTPRAFRSRAPPVSL